MSTSEISPRTEIADFLAHHRMALAGLSRDPRHFSRLLYRDLRARGYNVVPVNPNLADVDGVPCFATVRDVSPPVDAVLIMTPASATARVVEDCAQAGVGFVWMYRAGGQGAVSPEAVELCRERGIRAVVGECPYMFLPGPGWFHSLHGLLRKITGSYPR